MLRLRGFELYSRWVPLHLMTDSMKTKDLTVYSLHDGSNYMILNV